MTLETHSITSYQSIKLSRKYNYKSIVFSWQNMESVPKYFFQKYIQQKLLEDVDCLIVGTVYAKKYLIKKGADPDRIFIKS